MSDAEAEESTGPAPCLEELKPADTSAFQRKRRRPSKRRGSCFQSRSETTSAEDSAIGMRKKPPKNTKTRELKGKLARSERRVKVLSVTVQRLKGICHSIESGYRVMLKELGTRIHMASVLMASRRKIDLPSNSGVSLTAVPLPGALSIWFDEARLHFDWIFRQIEETFSSETCVKEKIKDNLKSKNSKFGNDSFRRNIGKEEIPCIERKVRDKNKIKIAKFGANIRSNSNSNIGNENFHCDEVKMDTADYQKNMTRNHGFLDIQLRLLEILDNLRNNLLSLKPIQTEITLKNH